jgi:hypothetical protein
MFTVTRDGVLRGLLGGLCGLGDLGEKAVGRASVRCDRSNQIATVRVAVSPPSRLPLIVASSSAYPSLKMPSVARDTWLRFLALPSYPGVAYTESHAAFGRAICEVATLFETLVAPERLGYTSK